MADNVTEQPHLIEVKVNEIHQLFNSMDPSPFHERDLDHDAEQFIVSWAQERHKQEPLKIVIHLANKPEGVADPQALVAESIHHYFAYRADMTLRELKQLMREGRTSLLIGLVFLAACVVLVRILATGHQPWQSFLREGLTISGWVAMWKPLDIYLYRWWPLLNLKRLHEKISKADVDVRIGQMK